MTEDYIEKNYLIRHPKLIRVAEKIEQNLDEILKDIPRIDRIHARAKNPEKFILKALKLKEDGTPKYKDPLNEVQDQIGARVVTFYLEDAKFVSKEIYDHFGAIEYKEIVPDSIREFGYEGQHLVLFIPDDLLEPNEDFKNFPRYFELQVKTLFQHAWAEAEHDLGYKPDTQLTPKDKRYLAFTAAQSWGADEIFQMIYSSTDRKAFV